MPRSEDASDCLDRAGGLYTFVLLVPFKLRIDLPDYYPDCETFQMPL